MKRLLFLIAVMLAPLVGRATDDTWLNTGTLTSAPQVDAINFVNNGSMTMSTTVPFDTSNTRNFTNTGAMLGLPGFRFDTAPSANPGVRYMASSFYNGPLLVNGYGTVEARDPVLPSGINGYPPSYLLVSATNVVNKGMLAVGPNGLLQLTGTNVNVRQSLLQVKPIGAEGTESFTFFTSTNFYPAKGVRDVYWGQSNVTFASSSFYNGTDVFAFTNIFGQTTVFTTVNLLTPPHSVTNTSFIQTSAQISGYSWSTVQTAGYASELDPSVSSANNGVTLTVTNIGGGTSSFSVPTNTVRQAVFVGGSADTNFNINIGFQSSSIQTNLAKSVIVTISRAMPNLITGTNDNIGIFFGDRLAAETNRGLAKNLVDYTYRPTSFFLSRFSTGLGLGFGATSNAVVDENFLYQQGGTNANFPFQAGFVTNDVTAEYAGYSATISSLVSGTTATSPTNRSGRVEINADVLDLTRTRIRAEGHLSVKARHLIGSSGAVVDAGAVSCDIGSTNGTLRVEGLMPAFVYRLNGTIRAWSGVWDNQINSVYTNYTQNTTTLDWDYTPITNAANVRLHALVLDFSGLSTTQMVEVPSFAGHATNIVVTDPMMNVQSLLFDCRNLTLSNELVLGKYAILNTLTNLVTVSNGVLVTNFVIIPTLYFSNTVSWTPAVAPTLRNFTNFGSMIISGDAQFGDGQPALETFENQGYISAASQSIRGTNVYFTNGVCIARTGSLHINAQTNTLRNASLQCASDMHLESRYLSLSNTVVSSGGRLYFEATNVLMDAGAKSGNEIECGAGFENRITPATGDLLGTAVYSTAAAYSELEHIWSGRDRGPSKTGFTNNLAIGRLVLNGGVGSTFSFIGAGVSNAIYVDRLELLNGAVTNDASYNVASLNISPNMQIYYANATANGNPVADKIDGKNDGRLHWVPAFVGTFSSTNLVYPDGTTNAVNIALAQLSNVDSDNDGLVNSMDSTPVFVPSQVQFSLSLLKSPTVAAKLTWQTPPGATSHVFYKTALASTNWLELTNFITTPTAPGAPLTVSVTDPVLAGGMRYYQVQVDPQ